MKISYSSQGINVLFCYRVLFAPNPKEYLLPLVIVSQKSSNLFLHTHLVIYDVLHACYGNSSLFAKKKKQCALIESGGILFSLGIIKNHYQLPTLLQHKYSLLVFSQYFLIINTSYLINLKDNKLMFFSHCFKFSLEIEFFCFVIQK